MGLGDEDGMMPPQLIGDGPGGHRLAEPLQVLSPVDILKRAAWVTYYQLRGILCIFGAIYFPVFLVLFFSMHFIVHGLHKGHRSRWATPTNFTGPPVAGGGGDMPPGTRMGGDGAGPGRPPMDAGTTTALVMAFLLFIALSLCVRVVVIAVTTYMTVIDHLGRDFSAQEVTGVIRRTFLRVLATLVVIFVVMFGFTVVFGALAGMLVAGALALSDSLGLFVLLILLAVFGASLLYLITVLSLANVAAAIESHWGLGALRRSMHLVQGSKIMIFGLLLGVTFVAWALQAGQNGFVTQLKEGGAWGWVLPYLVFVVAHAVFNLYQELVMVVVYFVCRCKHSEGFDHTHLVDFVEGVQTPSYVAVPLSEKA